jgi:hypothetical protein
LYAFAAAISAWRVRTACGPEESVDSDRSASLRPDTSPRPSASSIAVESVTLRSSARRCPASEARSGGGASSGRRSRRIDETDVRYAAKAAPLARALCAALKSSRRRAVASPSGSSAAR